ncbi:PAS domain S-box protein [Methylorubrum extorquens]|uniref:Blue-light-activated histidine kinase n=1 Tax=Methylorubrum extorquens TaxID=408 RepID=A0AAX3WDQ6_METEX|nr:PAS domain S-box protein [Methylorubrum extorquens]WHQ68621.1 PAS domain S-box protein [Methylorubrum extorquens]
MVGYEQMMQRQRMLADFGEFTLRSEDLDEVLTEACRLVGEALGTGRAKILEIQKDGQCLFARAGVGWDPGVVGHLRLPMREHSSETFAIKEGKPVVTQDIRGEQRFDVPEFMRHAGVVALVNVPIRLPGGKAYGLLEVDTTEPHEFGDDDIVFLRTYASILGPVIDRLHKVTSLRSTEERFRLVVENARDYAIFITDPQDRITDWYPGAEAVFGWSAEDATGQASAILFTPEDREAGQDAKETEMARREGSALDVRWRQRKDGSRVFIEGMTTTLRHPDGSLRGFLKVGQDVTERRQSEEQVAAMFANAAVGLSQVAQDGRFLRANDELCRILGRTRDEVLGLTIVDVTHPDDVPPSLAAASEALRTNQPASLDKRYRRPDGTLVWANSRIKPLQSGLRHPSTLLVVTADLTDRRAAEERLRESEERLQLAVDVGRLGTWDWNTETGDISWSDEHYRILGYKVGEVTPSYETWAARIHPDDFSGTEAALRRAGNERHDFVHSYRFLHPDGSVRWCDARGRFFYDQNGRPVRMVGTLQDTTERREWAERQSVLVEELQHRTRNLLTVVRAIAQQTMARTGPTEEFRQQFNDRLAALSRVQRLLSRSDQEPITIHALVQTELDALGGDMQGRVALEGPPVKLRKRSVQTLALALHELATNARKYGALANEQGELWVSWDTYSTEEGERRLSLIWLEEGFTRSPKGSRAQRGYGRELIEKALPYALQARTSYELSETELRCSIDLPLTDDTKTR